MSHIFLRWCVHAQRYHWIIVNLVLYGFITCLYMYFFYSIYIFMNLLPEVHIQVFIL